MRVRTVTEQDAEAFVRLLNQIDGESDFMLYEPGERSVTAEQQREKIAALGERSTILVAELEGALTGYVMADGGFANRNKHCAYLVVGVLQACSGRGVGTRLFEELERWAVDRRLTRLELTVMRHNERAIALYRKMGFDIEGVKRRSLFVNGEYVDEYYMGKLLEG
ncbi:GNAT family N-acetyltransferase [Paenibacillus sp.]|uniref:GNAT family N-acetyltransferase n=1 Tax=Paenibacillus sp. TaxID=58172 RepID=UPI002D39E3AB|nr:GNAT family N-acetyltransferase [Paenibacillus sp.]HZG86842.1 GNAT family N-acetyltransferase [Paenibacillus sp.]